MLRVCINLPFSKCSFVKDNEDFCVKPPFQQIKYIWVFITLVAFVIAPLK